MGLGQGLPDSWKPWEGIIELLWGIMVHVVFFFGAQRAVQEGVHVCYSDSPGRINFGGPMTESLFMTQEAHARCLRWP